MLEKAKEHVAALVDRLEQHPESDKVRPILEITEQLQRALAASHFEGIRFRAFALSRLVARPDAPVGEAERQIVSDIRTALEAAGLALKH